MKLTVLTLLSVVCVGCSSVSTHMTQQMIEGAMFQMERAKEVGASELDLLANAEKMIEEAQKISSQNKAEAYRFGRKAFANAKIATELAIRDRLGSSAKDAEEKVEKKLRNVDLARQELEYAKSDLEQVMQKEEE